MGGVQSSPPSASPPGSAAALFAIVWEALVDVLGSAATAALVTRSVRIAAERRPDLASLRVQRVGFEYRYTLPERWGELRPEPLSSLRDLARSLRTLLGELTGSVVTRRLGGIPALREAEIRFDQESP